MSVGAPIFDLTTFMEPELRAQFGTFPDAIDAAAEPDEARRIVLAAAVARRPQPRESVASRDLTIPELSGNGADVALRVYEPRDREGLLPAILYVHGGGFIIGSLDGARPIAEELAEEINAVVVSADYRLAPEHPFPAATDDVYAALAWLAASTSELQVDGSRIAIVGHSAGGGIAAAVALMARDRGEVELVFQAPVCACLDDRHITPSSEIIRDPRTWHRDRARRAWAAYLGGKIDGEVSSYAAPARAADLTGLPATFVMVGELDLLRDENLDYAHRLIEAGVPTELHLYAGAFHGFELLLPDASVSRDANAALRSALQRALHPPA